MSEFAGLELWKPVEGWPYEVSNFGNVRRLTTRIYRSNSGRKLQTAVSRGYLHVTVCDGGFRSTIRVHVAVCTAFHGPKPSPRHHAAHRDGNKSNNTEWNLRWATPEENQADRVGHGTDLRGEDVRGAMLCRDDVPRIKSLLRASVPCAVIADAWGVNASTIHCIKAGKTWQHIGENT